MNERGQSVRVPDNLLNKEGKRIARRAGRGVFSLLIGTVLSYIGLFMYLEIAPQPNLNLIKIWLAAPAVVLPLGITLINKYLDRTLPLHRAADDVNDLTTDSN